MVQKTCELLLNIHHSTHQGLLWMNLALLYTLLMILTHILMTLWFQHLLLKVKADIWRTGIIQKVQHQIYQGMLCLTHLLLVSYSTSLFLVICWQWLASSTDAEHAFLAGWHKVNFMQHNMSLNTFKSEMAIGSWDGTPLMPNVTPAIRTMEEKMMWGSQDSELNNEMDIS